jgi:hypothetical protein
MYREHKRWFIGVMLFQLHALCSVHLRRMNAEGYRGPLQCVIPAFVTYDSSSLGRDSISSFQLRDRCARNSSAMFTGRNFSEWDTNTICDVFSAIQSVCPPEYVSVSAFRTVPVLLVRFQMFIALLQFVSTLNHALFVCIFPTALWLTFILYNRQARSVRWSILTVRVLDSVQFTVS